MTVIKPSSATAKKRRQGASSRSILSNLESNGTAQEALVDERSDDVPIPRHSPMALAVKRAIDVVVTLVLGVIVFPLLVGIAVAIKLASRGPILYSQQRVGRNGQLFYVWKFRTMVPDADARLAECLADNRELAAEWNTRFKLDDDPRVIPWIGGFLRDSSLDELPQLWNVLLGQMSFVGPRPLPLYHLEQFDESFRLLRQSMPQGITGQWQVHSRNHGEPEMFQKWDTQYVCQWSLWLDLRILCRTPWVVLKGRRDR